MAFIGLLSHSLAPDAPKIMEYLIYLLVLLTVIMVIRKIGRFINPGTKPRFAMCQICNAPPTATCITSRHPARCPTCSKLYFPQIESGCSVCAHSSPQVSADNKSAGSGNRLENAHRVNRYVDGRIADFIDGHVDLYVQGRLRGNINARIVGNVKGNVNGIANEHATTRMSEQQLRDQQEIEKRLKEEEEQRQQQERLRGGNRAKRRFAID